jgi:ribosomal protein S18 acetylase RimI-like enzyme
MMGKTAQVSPMRFEFRRCRGDEDMSYVIATEYEASREAGLLRPATSEAESFTQHRQELLGFLGSLPAYAILLAHTLAGQAAGLVWVGVRTGGEPWDLEAPPAWIYDVRVEPRYRRQGLGRQLMRRAEAWAQREVLARIGLHVFGPNEAAMHLYTTLGYAATNLYVQKSLGPETRLPVGETAFHLRPVETETDERQILDLGYETFRTLAGTQVPEEAVRRCYGAFTNRHRLGEPHHWVRIAEGPDGAIAGFVWVYRSHGDLGDRAYTWLRNLEVSPAFRGRGLGRHLLACAEAWTQERGLDVMRTGIHTSQAVALHLLRAAGYRPTSIFMYKCVAGHSPGAFHDDGKEG